MFRWLVKLVVAVVVIGAGGMFFFSHTPGFPVSSVTTQKDSLFTVSGEGKVTVIPDTGIVSLGINISRSTVKATQTEANRIINTISAEVKKLGVDSKDIQTSNYSIYPQYDYNNGTNRITAYQINSTLTITVRDLEKLNTVIDSATGNGANTVSGVQLTVDEIRQKELQNQARDLAIKEAKTKAESLAKSAGISLGKIVNVQESAPSGRPLMYDLAASAKAVGGGGTQIEAGSADIVSNVVLSYETR